MDLCLKHTAKVKPDILSMGILWISGLSAALASILQPIQNENMVTPKPKELALLNHLTFFNFILFQPHGSMWGCCKYKGFD